MPTQQESRATLAAMQDRFEERRLTESFLRTMAALPSRPEPRHLFDNRVRADQRVPPPCYRDLALFRIILHAAVNTRDRDAINATRREIAHYFDDLKASALREVVQEDCSIDDALIGFHRESAEALTAVAAAGMDHVESAIARALREVREANDAGERLEELLGGITCKTTSPMAVAQ